MLCARYPPGSIVGMDPWAMETSPDETDDEPIFNDVPNMPDDWYWRDKPLHKNTVKVGQKYWVDQGHFYFEMELCFERGMNCTETCCK